MHSRAEHDLSPIEVVTRDQLGTDHCATFVSRKRDSAGPIAWEQALDRIEEHLAGTGRLFDVGAGDGGFLDTARQHGFTVGGSELQESAGLLAKERHGIELELGNLDRLGHHEDQDAVTMWCVLAHTPDADTLLRSAHGMLRPGGVLFLQTPRWTSADTAALTALTATRGRVSRVVDRRQSVHWILHSARSISAQLKRLGFEVLSVEPKARYSLSSAVYLESLRVPRRLVPVAGRAMDELIARGASFRIVLDVYARKPC